ncbi:FxsA family protein [Lacipirellula parvula]|uniref:FxsA cytoplasmic membrane protein n=1 Tax=Lacipirellula parvula TaxID=2650471 RepID=A0A5K7XR73_9BACT|nr:FxsA family protein [Lacipirellula parvula]BBO36359.1 hypothetical protein PLANPX_5971 [Lacipirellula parvula]
MIRSLLLFAFGYIILEMILLISLGRAIGLLPTLLLVLGAGFVGAWLARREGLRSAMRMRSQMAAGAMPAAELTDGLLIGLAAVLLIIPGVLGDVIGIALLLPPARAFIRRSLAAKFDKAATFSRFTVDEGGRAMHTPRGDQIIDARVIETRVVEE